MKMWSDGIERRNNHRPPDEYRMIMAIVEHSRGLEIKELLAENRKLRAELEKNKIGKAAGAK